MTLKQKNAKRMKKNYRANPEKFRLISLENRKRNPENKVTRLARLLKSRYNITFEKYQKLIDSQKELCAICQKKIKLTVDHNHKTGKVRGLLCGNCNRGLGMFFESDIFLHSAIRYIQP